MEVSDIILQDVFYNEDAPPEIIQAIKNRVFLIEDNIIVLDELQKVTPFSLNIVFTEMTELAKQLPKCAYLIDITDTTVPNAEARRFINAQFQATLSNVKHVTFVTGKNFLINTAAKFVMYQTNLKSFSIDKTREDGISKIKSVLKDG